MNTLYKKLIIPTIAILLIIISIIVVSNKIQKLRSKLDLSEQNVKAYESENDTLVEQSKQFQLTMSQLAYSKDSIICRLNEVRKELKVKDKNIKELLYLKQRISKADTILVHSRDTIFKSPEFKLDTVLGDKWYQLKLGLYYPNKLIVSPTFISEDYVIASYKKETVNPPKKFFLARLFQKKHKVIVVQVMNKSPYIQQKQQKFINIVK